MDARGHKVCQLVCAAVSWGHEIKNSNHEAALAVTQGSAGAGRGAHVNTVIMLESAELQQS